MTERQRLQLADKLFRIASKLVHDNDRRMGVDLRCEVKLYAAIHALRESAERLVGDSRTTGDKND